MGKKARKIVLAYSGGLDTSVILRWLHRDVRVRGRRLLRRPRPGRGADRRPREGAPHRRLQRAHRGSARGVRARLRLPDAARQRGVRGHATCSARRSRARSSPSARSRSRGRRAPTRSRHGATGKGNDQVRFELTYAALAPDLTVIAPWREWDLNSRTAAHRVRRAPRDPRAGHAPRSPYSSDRNLLHISLRGRHPRGSVGGAATPTCSCSPTRRKRRPTCPTTSRSSTRRATRSP